MSKLAVLVISLSACATAATGLDRETAPRAKVQLDFSTEGRSDAVFPSAIEPALPSVDRMARQIRAELGEAAVASINLCVSPAGKVTNIEILESSSSAAFDQAVLRDAKAWQFETMPGPATLQTCERARIKYLTP